MRVQSINQNNYSNKQNFKAGKYLSGTYVDMMRAATKIRTQSEGIKSATDKYVKPPFDLAIVPFDNGVFIATEDTVLTVKKIIQKSEEKSIGINEFGSFLRKKVSEYLKIDFKPQEATEMLKEMENPAYDYAKMTVKK